MSIRNILEYALSYFAVHCFFPIFIFLPVFTIGLQESDANLQLREILQNIFKKIF